MDFNLKELIDQLVKMKGIKRELIIDIVKEALYRAVQKKLGTEADIDIMYDDETGTLETYYFRLVTDRVEDPLLDISLEEARKIDPEATLGDTLGIITDKYSGTKVTLEEVEYIIVKQSDILAIIE